MATNGNDELMGTAGLDLLDGLAGNDTMIGGLGDDTYFVDSPGDVVVESPGEGIDTIFSSAAYYILPDNVEVLRLVGTGNIRGYGNDSSNELYGNAGANTLYGLDESDLIYGGDGADTLDSDGGDDFLDGGTGDDSLNGGTGDDTYVFGVGYGQDTAYDSGGVDRVQLTAGLSVSDVSLARIGNDVALTINATGDRLLLSNWFFDESRIESIEFANETMVDAAMIAAVVDNQAPTAANDSATVSAGTATGNVLANDSDGNGQLLSIANPGTYQGTYGTLLLGADGSYTYTLDASLPAFQALGPNDTAVESFSYVAHDSVPLFPGEATGQLNVAVGGLNDAPAVTAPLVDQSASAGQALDFAVAPTAFADVDAGDRLTFMATLANENPLPDWLAFDPATGRFTGTPPDAVAGTTLQIMVTANDLFGAAAADVFAISIAGNPAGTSGGQGRDIIGTPRNDRLVGTPFDDRIDGRRGYDVMIGGRGDDTYFVDATHGRRGRGCGDDRGWWGHRADRIVENPNEGHDAVYSSASYALPANVEDLHLLGSRNLDGTGNAQANWIEGNRGRNKLSGGAGDDLLQGLGGNDDLRGGAGFDVLQGGSGRDKLLDREGSTVFDGGSGDDSMTGGRAADFFAGGRGDDVLRLGGGHDVIAFFKGDGTDRIEGERQDGVLVLGGVHYEDLLFRKDGGDLVLQMGGHDRLVFDDWYRGKQSVATLEVIGAPSAGHDVETYDFRALVAAFDEARAAKRNMKSWALMNELLDAHLASSDDLALGGDLAHQYAMTGSLAGMGWSSARDTVAAPRFGAAMQALQPAAALAADAIKLGA